MIEMAREKNSDEKVAFINKMLKQNENMRQQIGSLYDLKKLNVKQFELMKLLIEQGFKCAYSGKQVGVGHVLNRAMEVDHIIHKSLSFDNSMANKVAVLSVENQKKGQATPCQYLKSGRGQQSCEEFKTWVLNNYKKNNFCEGLIRFLDPGRGGRCRRDTSPVPVTPPSQIIAMVKI